jgi:large subunit ribosomal protein L15
MYLHDVHKNVEKNRKRKRLGRGLGSGWGKTAGKGHKGHRSRSGFFARVAFQGSLPLFRHIPKRGFTNSFADKVVAINVESLEVFEDGAEVNPQILRETGLVRGRYDQLKILGDGELTKKLKVSAHRFSKSAKEKIEKAGGSVDVLGG